MLPPANFMSLDVTKASLQVSDKKHNFSESTELTASFAEVLRNPFQEPPAVPPASGGTLLPLPGSPLPAAGEDAELLLLADTVPATIGPAATPAFMPFIEGEIAPAAADATLRAGASPLVPPSPLPLATPPLASDPARSASLPVTAAVVGTDREMDVQRRNPGLTPFMRSATPLEQHSVRPLQPATSPVSPLMPATDEPLPLLLRSEALPVVAAGNAASAAIAAAGIAPVTRSVTVDPAELAEKLDGLVKLSAASGQGGATIATADTHQLQQTGALPARAATLPTTTINVPVGDDGWSESLQDRVMWMTSRNLQSAEIRLSPSELGPIRVQISVQDDATRLTFSAQHPLTREAIEQAMPRLREMLSDSGLSLAGSSVTDGSEDNVHKERHAREQAFGGDELSRDDLETDATPVMQRALQGLVDTFA